MAKQIRPPAAAPCGSCPYRRDVPSGVWDETEYAKLPRYDGETWSQEPTVFLCHQQDGRACAGWVGTHDMAESFGLRMAVQMGLIELQDVDAFLDYASPVPLFGSGQEAADHGRARLLDPDQDARKTIQRLQGRQAR